VQVYLPEFLVHFFSSLLHLQEFARFLRFLTSHRSGFTIRHETKEHGKFFDKNGNPISDTIVGEVDHIPLGEFQHLAKDAIFTHNHPGNGWMSLEDIQVAIDFNLAEMRAVTPNGKIFSLKRGGDGWQAALVKREAIKVQDILRRDDDFKKLFQMDRDAATELYFKKIAERIGGEFNFFKK
jgi:hypothetical protein